MGWTDRHDRIAVALLATLAFLVQLAAPQGFMLASANGAPSIVICTGHGPLLAPGDDHGLPDKGRKQTGACAFAGHGGAPALPELGLCSVRRARGDRRHRRPRRFAASPGGVSRPRRPHRKRHPPQPPLNVARAPRLPAVAPAAPSRATSILGFSVCLSYVLPLHRCGALCCQQAPGAALACACGCGVFDVGGDTMVASDMGKELFVEYDFLDQTQNWSRSHKAPAADNTDKRIRSDFLVGSAASSMLSVRLGRDGRGPDHGPRLHHHRSGPTDDVPRHRVRRSAGHGPLHRPVEGQVHRPDRRRATADRRLARGRFRPRCRDRLRQHRRSARRLSFRPDRQERRLDLSPAGSGRPALRHPGRLSAGERTRCVGQPSPTAGERSAAAR